MNESSVRQFVGQNIKGTPRMSRKKVKQDLQQVKRKRLGVAALQEMKWPWYWVALARVFGLPSPQLGGWGRMPRVYKGPRSAQPLVWRRSMYKVRKRRRKKLHGILPGIALARFANAVLLEDRESGLCCWYLSSHWIPGMTKSARHRKFWNQSRDRTIALIEECLQTGWPVHGSLDANARGRIFGARIGGREVTYIGDLGIDYQFSVDGRKAKVEIVNTSRIPLKDLNTDHAGRVSAHKIVKR